MKLMFPSLCTSHLCQCLDPYAIENRNELERAKLLSTDFNFASRALQQAGDKEIRKIQRNWWSQNDSLVDWTQPSPNLDQAIPQHLRPQSLSLSTMDLSLLNVFDISKALVMENVTKEELFMKPGFAMQLEALNAKLREYKSFAAKGRWNSRYHTQKIRSLLFMALREEYKNLQTRT